MFIKSIFTKLPAILKIQQNKSYTIYVQQINSMAKNVDNCFETFRKVCDQIAAESSYKAKAEILRVFFQKGTDGTGFKGDVLLWVEMLIPSASPKVYNLQNKQMLKLFAKIFETNLEDMFESLEQEGDVSAVLCQYFEKSKKLKPQKESNLLLHDVNDYLNKLANITKESDQGNLLLKISSQATALDLKTLIRLIKHDLRINARARHILDAFGPNAYETYQASNNLRAVVEKFNTKSQVPATSVATSISKKANSVNVMTPISPMLANACKSVEDAFKKSPEGLYCEVKYDGERVQIHKRGDEFRFFSRNLKPVVEHKIKRLKDIIPKAFPGVFEMILDSEIILVDKTSGNLLPFGSLGAHKMKEYVSAEVCLFVFDCIFFNGDNLINLTLKKRREILEGCIAEIKSYVQLSELHFLKTKNELNLMTAKVLQANLEGVVLKSPSGLYQPGKRGWLKVKKDYLFDGKMADTADLVVLGAWFGSGKKGGILSIFLMGCYDPSDKMWKTVTKVHSGLDDTTNAEIHQTLFKLFERANARNLPSWFLCKKPLVPDFIALDPLKMPVWEITGAEFTQSEAHTAAGISIRFPRITKLRDDKSAKEANDLPYLQKLFQASKEAVNVDLLIADCDSEEVKAIKIDSKVNFQDSPSKRIRMEGSEQSSEVNQRVKNKFSSDENTDRTKRKVSLKNESKELNNIKNNLDCNVTSHTRNNNAGPLFDNCNAYFSDSLRETHEELVVEFRQNGGTVYSNEKDCNIVFHLIPTKKLMLNQVRYTFDQNCHHLDVKWLKDSLNAKECLPFAPYAIIL